VEPPQPASARQNASASTSRCLMGTSRYHRGGRVATRLRPPRWFTLRPRSTPALAHASRSERSVSAQLGLGVLPLGRDVRVKRLLRGDRLPFIGMCRRGQREWRADERAEEFLAMGHDEVFLRTPQPDGHTRAAGRSPANRRPECGRSRTMRTREARASSEKPAAAESVESAQIG
jgi:hypothetical protein